MFVLSLSQALGGWNGHSSRVLGSLSSTPPLLSSVTQCSASLLGTSILRPSFGQRWLWFSVVWPTTVRSRAVWVQKTSSTCPWKWTPSPCWWMTLTPGLYSHVSVRLWQQRASTEWCLKMTWTQKPVAQILDFISSQTSIPIVGISGGSAVVIPHKVSV